MNIAFYSIRIVEIALLAPLGAVTAYLAILSLLSFFGKRRAPRNMPGDASRIAVVVPAHNEEGTIRRTLSSLAGLEYPAERTGTIVVADNCTDGTARAARSAGATVLERSSATEVGKGYALRRAFDALLSHVPPWDGFVVVDADSTVSANFLRVMDAHLRDGADAIQSNDQAAVNARSWSSEIIRLGFTLYNFVRPLGRGVIGGSAGLRGNGMCFSASLLRRLPWNAFGVTEDLQYGLHLLLNGVRVRFAPDALVTATMPAAASNAETQRVRWEKGRLPVKRRYGRALLAGALRSRSWALIDAWIDLMTPPFVQLMALNGALVCLHLILWAAAPALFTPWLAAWAAVFSLGLVHVFAGLASAGADRRLYIALLHVPRYALWKLHLRKKHPSSGSPEGWIRTAREEAGDDVPGENRTINGISVHPHTKQ